jgi:hypothetical protein
MKEPLLPPNELEMIDETRRLQTKTGLDPSERTFWETVKYLQRAPELKTNYNNVRFLYPLAGNGRADSFRQWRFTGGVFGPEATKSKLTTKNKLKAGKEIACPNSRAVPRRPNRINFW